MKKLWLRDIACLIRHHLVCSSKSLVKVFFLIVFMTKKRQHCTRDKTIDARSLTSYIEGYGCWLSLIQTGSLSMWSVILCRLYTVARPAADMHTFTISDGWSWVQPSPAARCTSLVPPPPRHPADSWCFWSRGVQRLVDVRGQLLWNSLIWRPPPPQ